MASRKEAKKRGRELLRLANNDEWKECNSILQHAAGNGGVDVDVDIDVDAGTEIWLKNVTEDGDGLLHLAAFSSCDEDDQGDEQDETGPGNGNSVYAYKCLELVLQLDPFSVQRYSSDGGTALHAAIAAASPGSPNDPSTAKPDALTVIRALLTAGSDPNAPLRNVQKHDGDRSKIPLD
eukprot:CAMPEP_0194450108 /NCGR_PEP_ID=MMETSP0176-20130528/130522_1 /TAXON_ID=216777 /ORGANISM="Proboscia alata, Strain PI-D3" /LENGTH=178 /DNA_ID=CAMNT_0039277325 /DNA_START=50 /DNA_END=586 /DNA_ORIENTATION=-